MNFHWSQGHLIFFLSITALTHGRYLFFWHGISGVSWFISGTILYNCLAVGYAGNVCYRHMYVFQSTYTSMIASQSSNHSPQCSDLKDGNNCQLPGYPYKEVPSINSGVQSTDSADSPIPWGGRYNIAAVKKPRYSVQID